MAWYDPGKKVVYIHKGELAHANGRPPKSPNPHYNEVCEVVRTGTWRGYPIVWLAGYGDTQSVDCAFGVWNFSGSPNFRPIDPASKKADRGLAALKDGIKTVREREEA